MPPKLRDFGKNYNKGLLLMEMSFVIFKRVGFSMEISAIKMKHCVPW